VVGVALQQGAEDQQLIHRRALRFGLHRAHEPEDAGFVGILIALALPATLLDEIGQPGDHRGDIVARVGGQHAQRTRHVFGPARDRAELDPVGDLVQAYPQPEVRR